MKYPFKILMTAFGMGCFISCYKVPLQMDKSPVVSKVALCGSFEKTWQVEQLIGTYAEFDRVTGKW